MLMGIHHPGTRLGRPQHPSGGFVRYHYHLPGVHGSQEKLAFVIGLPELESYIGTGMYLQQTIRDQEAILQRTKYGAIALLIVVLFPIAVAVRAVVQRNRLLFTEIHRANRLRKAYGQRGPLP